MDFFDKDGPLYSKGALLVSLIVKGHPKCLLEMLCFDVEFSNLYSLLNFENFL